MDIIDSKNSSPDRQPTANETLYLQKQIKTKRTAFRTGYYLLLACSIILTPFVIRVFSFKLLGGVIMLILLGFLIFLVIKYHLAARLSSFDKVDTIVSIEGMYYQKLEGYGRVKTLRYYIDNNLIYIPVHWRKYVKNGEHVQAEVYFYTTESLTGKGGLYQQCELISLNNKYFIDREIPLGLLNRKFNFSLVFAGVLLLVISVIGLITYFVSNYTPYDLYQKYVYDKKEVRQFDTVDEVFSRDNPVEAGSKIFISKAALAPSPYQNYVYFFKPTEDDSGAIINLAQSAPNETTDSLKDKLFSLYSRRLALRKKLLTPTDDLEFNYLSNRFVNQVFDPIGPLVVRGNIQGILSKINPDGKEQFILDTKYSFMPAANFIEIIFLFLMIALILGIHGFYVFGNNKRIIDKIRKIY